MRPSRKCHATLARRSGEVKPCLQEASDLSSGCALPRLPYALARADFLR
jgi:hypothetical protein